MKRSIFAFAVILAAYPLHGQEGQSAWKYYQEATPEQIHEIGAGLIERFGGYEAYSISGNDPYSQFSIAPKLIPAKLDEFMNSITPLEFLYLFDRVYVYDESENALTYSVWEASMDGDLNHIKPILRMFRDAGGYELVREALNRENNFRIELYLDEEEMEYFQETGFILQTYISTFEIIERMTAKYDRREGFESEYYRWNKIYEFLLPFS